MLHDRALYFEAAGAIAWSMVTVKIRLVVISFEEISFICV